MRSFVVACLLLIFGYAHAGTVGYTVGHTPAGASATFGETGSVLDAITNRTVGTQVINNAITLSDVIDATVAGNRIGLANARVVTLGEVAAATAAVGAAAYAGCAAGTAIANYAGMGNGTNNGSRLSCNLTDWLFDDGQAPNPSSTVTQTQVRYGYNGSTGPWNVDPRIACESAPAYGTSWNTPVWNAANNSCRAYNKTNPSSYLSYGASYRTVDVVTESSCPASIDALNPAFSTPAGAAPGPDGKCPTGRYSAVTPDDAKRILTLYGTVSHAPDALKWLVDNKKPVPIVDGFHLTGPGSVTGSPSTSVTTNPDGSTVTTTTNPRTDYTYDGNTVNWTVNNTTVVQTCVEAGSCTTTTTTTDETKTECELNPFSAGCGGDPASAGSLYTKKDRTFQTVLTSGRDAILATPLGSAMGNFFTIAGGGSCPIWTWDIPYIKAVVVVDEFCSDWAMTAYAVMKGAVLIVFAWVAFRWAVL